MTGKNLLSDGITYYRQRKYTDALTFFLSLPENPEVDNTELAYYIGLCYAKLQKYDDALLYLEQVVVSGQNLDRVMQCRFLLSVIYAMSGRKRLAIFELEKLLESGYKTASVYAAMAYIFWVQNDIKKSIEYYKKALEIDPENVTALNGIGYVLACEDVDLSQALVYCKKALKNAPDNAACLDSLGWVYYKLGLLVDARKYLKQAENIFPDNQEIRNHIQLLEEAEHTR